MPWTVPVAGNAAGLSKIARARASRRERERERECEGEGKGKGKAKACDRTLRVFFPELAPFSCFLFSFMDAFMAVSSADLSVTVAFGVSKVFSCLSLLNCCVVLLMYVFRLHTRWKQFGLSSQKSIFQSQKSLFQSQKSIFRSQKSIFQSQKSMFDSQKRISSASNTAIVSLEALFVFSSVTNDSFRWLGVRSGLLALYTRKTAANHCF